MNGLEITKEQIERLGRLPDKKPVIMANLCKFRVASSDGEGTGRDAYFRYSRRVISLLKKRGGTILWAGNTETVALGLPQDGDLDFIVLVKYPTRAAFIDMMTSPEYAECNMHRLNGLARHTIIAIDEQYNSYTQGTADRKEQQCD